MSYEKKFDEWNVLKRRVNARDALPSFKEREVWWCYLGVNVGFEEDGKHVEFSRPVLVLKKFSNNLFLGIPFTTKLKDHPHYHKIVFQQKEESALLMQVRATSSKRLIDKVGRLSGDEFAKIKQAVKDLL